MADEFNRQKMRWLNSVFYSSQLKAMACRVAYIIADRVNRITGDCWLSHTTIARKLRISTKTVQRSLGALQRTGFIVIRYAETNRRKQRFVPSFVISDHGLDSDGSSDGQGRPPVPDPGVHQSFSKNLHTSYLPENSGSAITKTSGRQPPNDFRRGNRGQMEVEIAKRLGADGFDILHQLAEVDDRIVHKLCVAQANNSLSADDLVAARLAARQVR
jgi:hypothetical protein